eukprot:scaffold12431_cov94-Cyclotella_meneghiniana.AAC.8
MIGAEAVIGVPADNTVKKYILFGKSVDAITMMNEADQTLMDTTVTTSSGATEGRDNATPAPSVSVDLTSSDVGVPSTTSKSPMAPDLFSPAPYAEVQAAESIVATVESTEETIKVSAEEEDLAITKKEEGTAETTDISVDGAEKACRSL